MNENITPEIYGYVRVSSTDQNEDRQMIEYNSHSTKFRKLPDGNILVNSLPDVIFNPYTGEVEEKYNLLTDEERDDFIYSTD